MMDYAAFVASKKRLATEAGFIPKSMPSFLFPFQDKVTRWALKKGRSAIFGGTGTGKTAMELAWADAVCNHIPGATVLILAPLAVGRQTESEAKRFGIHAKYVRDMPTSPGIYITNYEMLSRFNPDRIDAIVLDESSIIKSFDGKTRTALIDFAADIDLRLAATATPAPNDHEELIQHAEWLGVMRGVEARATFFTLDGNNTNAWRLKRHAESDWWDFVASWSVAFTHPSQVGECPPGFNLPNLVPHRHETSSDSVAMTDLFGGRSLTLQEQRQVRRDSIEDRVKVVADLVANEPDEHWLIWCDLNAESDSLRNAIPGSVEVRGSDKLEQKEESLHAFTNGEIKVLISKPSICGFGMNWQHCARVAFCGMSHSWERYYQAVRRCWRFGQTRDVHEHIVYDRAESSIIENIDRKQQQAETMMRELVDRIMKHHNPDTLAERAPSLSAQSTPIPQWITA